MRKHQSLSYILLKNLFQTYAGDHSPFVMEPGVVLTFDTITLAIQIDVKAPKSQMTPATARIALNRVELQN